MKTKNFIKANFFVAAFIIKLNSNQTEVEIDPYFIYLHFQWCY